MLLQNQQAGQANQTALQDNLNNNHSNAPAPGPEPAQPGPQSDPPTAAPIATASEGGEVRSELNWVAQTAAIIAEALSNQQPPSLSDTADVNRGEGTSLNDVTTAAGNDYPVSGFQPEEEGLPQTDYPPAQSPGTDRDCTAEEQSVTQ